MKNQILVNKIYFNLLSLLSFFILLFSFNKNKINDFETVLLFSFLILIILFFLYKFFIAEELNYYPINFFFNIYFLIVTLIFVFNFNYIYENIYPLTFLRDAKIDIYYNKDLFVLLLVKALYILIITVFFFNLGFLICLKILKNKTLSFFKELNELKLLRVSFTLLTIKLFLLLINLKNDVNFTNLLDPLNLLLASVTFYLILNHKKNRKINFTIIIFIFFENIFFTAALYKNIILLILLIVIFYKIKKKFSFFLLIFLVCWVTLGQGFKNQFRSYLENPSTDYVIPQKIEIKNYKKIVNNFQGRAVLLRSTEPILSLMRIKELEILRNDVVKKDTISILIYSLIPRVLYPNKPTQDFAKWYSKYYFLTHNNDPNFTKSVTFNIFWPSDFYLNQGYYGSILISFIIGFIICFLVLFFSNFNSANINFLLGISVLSGLTFPDYNISMMFSPIILQYLFLFLIIRFLLFIDKKN